VTTTRVICLTPPAVLALGFAAAFALGFLAAFGFFAALPCPTTTFVLCFTLVLALGGIHL
jgi:hypothetical protein